MRHALPRAAETTEYPVMQLCPKCNNSPLPYVMVIMVSSVLGYVTWLILGLSIAETLPRAVGTGLVFLAVGGTLLHYVRACLKRHCRHGPEHRHGSHPRPPASGARPAAPGRSG